MYNEHYFRVFSFQSTVKSKQENGKPEAKAKPEPPLALERATISIYERHKPVDHTESHETGRECHQQSIGQQEEEDECGSQDKQNSVGAVAIVMAIVIPNKPGSRIATTINHVKCGTTKYDYDCAQKL